MFLAKYLVREHARGDHALDERPGSGPFGVCPAVRLLCEGCDGCDADATRRFQHGRRHGLGRTETTEVRTALDGSGRTGVREFAEGPHCCEMKGAGPRHRKGARAGLCSRRFVGRANRGAPAKPAVGDKAQQGGGGQIKGSWLGVSSVDTGASLAGISHARCEGKFRSQWNLRGGRLAKFFICRGGLLGTSIVLDGPGYKAPPRRSRHQPLTAAKSLG